MIVLTPIEKPVNFFSYYVKVGTKNFHRSKQRTTSRRQRESKFLMHIMRV